MLTGARLRRAFKDLATEEHAAGSDISHAIHLMQLVEICGKEVVVVQGEGWWRLVANSETSELS